MKYSKHINLSRVIAFFILYNNMISISLKVVKFIQAYLYEAMHYVDMVLNSYWC